MTTCRNQHELPILFLFLIGSHCRTLHNRF